jgi:hypothetical protein
MFAGPVATPMGDEAGAHRAQHCGARNANIGGKVFSGPPALYCGLDDSQPCQWVTPLHPVHVIGICAVTNEALDFVGRKQPTIMRAAACPTCADEKAGIYPGPTDCTMVDAEQTLDVVQTQGLAPTRSSATFEMRNEGGNCSVDLEAVAQPGHDLLQLDIPRELVDQVVLGLRPAAACAAATADSASRTAASALVQLGASAAIARWMCLQR